MIITTTNDVQGYIIEEYKGLVSVSQVAGTGFFSDFTASLSDVFGGRSGTYRGQLESLYNEVNNTLSSKASEKGGNAIVGYHIDFDEISGGGKSMFMVTVSGTAVKIAKDRYKFLKTLHELSNYHQSSLLTDKEYEYEVQRLKKLNDDISITKESEEYFAKKQREEAEKEAIKKLEEEKNRKFQEEMRKKIEKEEKFASLLSGSAEVSGFHVGDVVTYLDDGTCGTILGFTADGQIALSINNENVILNQDQIEPIYNPFKI